MSETAEAKIPEKVFNFQESRFWQKKAGRNKDLLHMDSGEPPVSQRDKITNKSDVQAAQETTTLHTTTQSAGRTERKCRNTTGNGILPSGNEHPPRVTKRQVSEPRFVPPFATEE